MTQARNALCDEANFCESPTDLYTALHIKTDDVQAAAYCLDMIGAFPMKAAAGPQPRPRCG